MVFNRIALFNNFAHSVNLGRQILLAKKTNHFVFQDRKKFKSAIKNAESVLVADDVDISCLLYLYIEISLYRNRKIHLNILFLELYTISFRALINEMFWYLTIDNLSITNFIIQLYYTPKRFLRLILFRLLLRSRTSTIYLPSALRIKFVSSLLSKSHQFIRVRNLLFDNLDLLNNKKLEFKPYSYLFIAGNVYYINDFEKVCNFALKNSIKIVVASGKKLNNKLVAKFKDTIIQTGPLKHHKIIELTKNCIAGIAVFSYNNINQNMAASSKIYEYAAYGKPIITSRVPGVEMEVQEFSINNVFYIDQLTKINLENIPLIKNEFDSSFCFNNELLNL